MIPELTHDKSPMKVPYFRQLCLASERLAANGKFDNGKVVVVAVAGEGVTGQPGVSRIYRITYEDVTGIVPEGAERILVRGNPGMGAKIEGFWLDGPNGDDGFEQLLPVGLPRSSERALGNDMERLASRVPATAGERLGLDLQSAQIVDSGLFDDLVRDWAEVNR